MSATAARTSALNRARSIGHGLTAGAALVFAALLALDMGDDEAVRVYYAELTGLGQEALPVKYFTLAIGGYIAVLDGNAVAGRRRILATLDDVVANPPAPGMQAILQRILLAACVADDDRQAAGENADRLMTATVSGRIWAVEAERRRAAAAAVAPRNG